MALTKAKVQQQIANLVNFYEDLRAALADHPRPEDPLVMRFAAREDLIYDDTAIR